MPTGQYVFVNELDCLFFFSADVRDPFGAKKEMGFGAGFFPCSQKIIKRGKITRVGNLKSKGGEAIAAWAQF